MMEEAPLLPTSQRHGYQPPPLCLACIEAGLPYWNAECSACLELVKGNEEDEFTVLSGSELFALLRQWSPSVQQSADVIIQKALKIGVGANDVDDITGMSLFHYAILASANGLDPTISLALVKDLVENHQADLLRESRWTGMNALQHAVFFDCSHIVDYFLTEFRPHLDVDCRCPEFFSGSLMHLSAFSTCTQTAKILLKHGADCTLHDNLGMTPSDVAELTAQKYNDSERLDIMCEHQNVRLGALELCDLLRAAEKLQQSVPAETSDLSVKPSPTVQNLVDVMLADKGLKIGDRVRLKPNKFGTLRYCGEVNFAVGFYAGIELDAAAGKNDGTVDGVSYFVCAPSKGVFVPLRNVERLPPPSDLKFGYSLIEDFLKQRADMQKKALEAELFELYSNNGGIETGHRVVIGSKQTGTVRYIGETHFASGIWYGIELDRAIGRNDGSVDGRVYFQTQPKFGIFAPPDKIMKIPERKPLVWKQQNVAHGRLQTTTKPTKAVSTPEFSVSKQQPIAPIRKYKQAQNRPKKLQSTNPAGLTPQAPSKPRPSSAAARARRRTTSVELSNLTTSWSTPSKHQQSKSSSYSSLINDRSLSTEAKASDIRSLPAEPVSSYSLTSVPPSEPAAKIEVGTEVTILNLNERGIVRYIGDVDFARGLWLGVELDAEFGNNDGEILGKRYFTCTPNRGYFAKSTRVRLCPATTSSSYQQPQ